MVVVIRPATPYHHPVRSNQEEPEVRYHFHQNQNYITTGYEYHPTAFCDMNWQPLNPAPFGFLPKLPADINQRPIQRPIPPQQQYQQQEQAQQQQFLGDYLDHAAICAQDPGPDLYAHVEAEEQAGPLKVFVYAVWSRLSPGFGERVMGMMRTYFGAVERLLFLVLWGALAAVAGVVGKLRSVEWSVWAAMVLTQFVVRAMPSLSSGDGAGRDSRNQTEEGPMYALFVGTGRKAMGGTGLAFGQAAS